MMNNKYWKFLFSVFIIEHLLFTITPAQAQNKNWSWAHSGGGNGIDQLTSVAVDNIGGVVVTGFYADSASFSGTVLHGTKGSHIFLARYANDGSLIWIKTSGMVHGQSQGNGVTVSKDNYIYVTGYFSDTLVLGTTILISSGSYDIFLAKYDSAGNLQWAVRGGGTGYNLSRSVSTDKVSGNIYITGSFSGTAHFGNKSLTSLGGDDIFLAAYDPAGTVLWVKNFGSRKDDAGYGITTSDSGNIAVTGMFADTADFAGKKLIAKGKSDIFIAKYSSTGELLWAEQAGDTAYGQGASVVMDSKENLYVTGRFYFDGPGSVPDCDGIGNIYIAKYNSAGAKKWMKCAGNGGEESGDAIAIDSSGYIYVAGGYDFTIDFGTGKILNSGLIDAYFVKFNSDGVAQWADRAGAAGDDYGTTIALDWSNTLFVGGAFSDTAFFGQIKLQSQHLQDAFIAKIGSTASVNSKPISTFHFSINPNPSQSAITFTCENDKNSVSVEVTNLLGIVCKKNIFYDSAVFTLLLDDLPKGIYFCRATTNSWNESRMIVLQ